MELITLSLLLRLLASSIAPSSTTIEIQAANDPSERKQAPFSKSFSISLNNACKVHNPFPKNDETVAWSGDCKSGYAQGPGIVSWYQHEEQYAKETGVMAKGKLTGYVVTEFVEGDAVLESYLGEIDHGIRQGYGIYTYSDGSSYKGEFKKNKQTGYAKLYLPPNQQQRIDFWQSRNMGGFVGDNYVIEGLFKNGTPIIACKVSACPKTEESAD